MEPHQLLADIDSGKHLANVQVFRFSRLRTVINFVLYTIVAVALVAAGLFLSGSLDPNAGGVYYGAIAVWALLLLASLWRALSKLLDLMSAQSNLLLVAPFGVICRRRKRVKNWSFEEYPENTTVVSNRQIESIYLNRKGRTFDQMLVDDGSFGPMAAIASAIDRFRPAGGR